MKLSDYNRPIVNNGGDTHDDMPQSLVDNEREAIAEALERNSGRRKIAARELGISERTLYRKIKEYGLE